MTERLHYDDSYLKDFTARVVEQLIVKDKPAVILDRTALYATSGGQPFDTGTLNDAGVIDVFTRDEDSAVIHVLEKEITDEVITGHVDWDRRFDHMQHHTGQHILTQAFVQTSEAKTVGFHLSPDSVTIDLDMLVTDAMVDKAEDLANQIVFENRVVSVILRDMNDQEGVRIRKLPKHLLTEGLRVIEIEGFDTTACGGTHVARTGEIGMIKVVKMEKRGTKTRVEFRCGGRALYDYRAKNRVTSRVASDLDCRFEEMAQAVNKLRETYTETLSSLKTAKSELIQYEADRLYKEAILQGNLHLITRAFDKRDPAEVKMLAGQLAEYPSTVALLSTTGEKAQLFFARSENLTIDMGKLLKDTLADFGGRGGGQAPFAQGGAANIDLTAAHKILEKATTQLVS